MKYATLLIMIIVACFAQAQNTFPQYKLSGNKLIYKGETIQLNDYNILLDGNINKPKSKYVYNDVNKAIAALKNGQDEGRRMTLYVAPWVYWIDNPDEPTICKPREGENIPIGKRICCNWLAICGLTDNAEDVVFACNRGQMQGAVGNFTMFLFEGDGLCLKNITFGNYCNVDLEYKQRSELSRKRRSNTITQAQLAFIKGDKAEAHNCRFVSRLNTCPLNGARRTLFECCHFEMTDDALSGTAVYLNCTFDLYGSRPFYCTSEAGAVILNSDFRILHEGEQYLTKVESPITLVDCRFHAPSQRKINWTPYPSYDLRCYKYNVTLNGEDINLSGNRPNSTIDMRDKDILRAYKCAVKSEEIYNTYNLLSGDDNWDPMGIKKEIEQAEIDQKIKLTKIPICLKISIDTTTIIEGGETAQAQVEAIRFGSYPMYINNISWKTSRTDVVELRPKQNNKAEIKSTNNTDIMRQLSVIASDTRGLEGSTTIISRPSELPPPHFTQNGMPQIISLPYGCMVNYSFDIGQRYDESEITWYRCEKKEGGKCFPIAVSHDNRPALTYLFQPGDEDHFIKASIKPKNIRSNYGETVSVVTTERVKKEQIIDNIYYTDFQNFPTEYQPEIREGMWTLDGYKPIDTKAYEWEAQNDSWYYGQGTDGAQEKGLMQKERGARMRYTPTKGNYGDMSLTIEIDPCKPAGQGFGSPTGQYMDICIKFDTRNLTGYGLRIERTTKYSKAVDFTLIKYQNGEVTPISKPISTTCYKSTCIIKLYTQKGELIVDAESDVPQQQETSELKSKVNLRAKIKENTQGGIHIQHTGTCGASASQIRSLLVKWDKY